jgi:hypothetical protein
MGGHIWAVCCGSAGWDAIAASPGRGDMSVQNTFRINGSRKSVLPSFVSTYWLSDGMLNMKNRQRLKRDNDSRNDGRGRFFFKAISFLFLSMTLVVSPMVKAHQIGTNGGNSMSNHADNEAKGRALRVAIDKRYKEMERNHTLKPTGAGRNDISDVVLEFIPVGTSFPDAEEILVAAGFKVGRPGSKPPFPNYYSVSAEIDQYVPTLFGRTSVNVNLEPKDPKDWSKVHAVRASILLQFI